MPQNILYIGNKLATHGRTASTIDTLGPLLEAQGFKLRYASTKRNKVLRFIDMLVTVVRHKRDLDVVLIDTYSTANFWYAIIIGKLCTFLKINYVPILHGGNLPARLKTHNYLLKPFLNNAYRVVSPSDYLKHAFAKASHTKITVINNNIELSQYPYCKRQMVQPHLLWVRAFATLYNPIMALETLKIVLIDFPNARLTMVGPDKDGSLEQCKLLATSLNLPVTFTGLLSRDAWIEQSKTCDIFINTSKFDNLPVSIIEAMALGLPVVSTAVGGIPYLIKNNHNGLTVTPSNPHEMARAIKIIATNKELANTLSTNGLATAQSYDWEVIKEKWVSLLR